MSVEIYKRRGIDPAVERIWLCDTGCLEWFGMYYPEDVIMDIRSGNDIVSVVGDYVKLTRKGSNYFGLCPFHNEKTPSFTVNREKQIYHCFGCGAGGNVFRFISEMENLSFPETVRFLARRINYTLPENTNPKEDSEKRAVKEKLREMHKKAARFYYDCLNADMGAAAREYLDERGISIPIRKKFGLGYAPDSWDKLYNFLIDSGFESEMIVKSGLASKGKSGKFYDRFRNRVMFPIIDASDNIIAFGGRRLSDNKEEAKYLNSPDTEIFSKSYNPYNLNFARRSGEREFILVEGYMDVISLYQAGFKSAVAACGTAFNDKHASVLQRYTKNMVVLFDSDEAGERAVLKALPVLAKADIKCRVMQVVKAKDPDEFIKKFGAEAFAKLLKNAVSPMIFRIGLLRKKYSLDDADGKINFISEAVRILADAENEITLDVYINEIAKSTGVSPETLKTETMRIRRSGARQNNDSAAQPDPRVKDMIIGNAAEDARSSLINLIATDKALFERVADVMDKTELADELYIKLYDIIAYLHKRGKPVSEADVMSYLDPEDTALQSRAALVFTGRLPYNNSEQKYKALFDSVRKIKADELERRLNSETDDQKVKQLLKEQKELDSRLRSKLRPIN